ncbi:DUF4150 domain-containing protein [Pseudoduganella buxea]|uniref:DUF4150 domain-containing protein n=1 Tax=Pseudoduganella buxea TaxID=1949069 RepID=A0A6I3SVK4_9BURK|nr:DUF4150 domain-containing protein [Pseudoduganella buxea]MTV53268.1 DUF4150 domain-containing protein [Pseudoduganella buxea]GGC13141.1 hypothetical protein GCM10011572_38140 [Pseudoduganella buxea]
MGKIGARRNSILKAVCTAPSFNKTPVGASTPPLPYATTQDLSNSVSITPTVRFNGDPAYVLDRTQQPNCRGDDPGVAKGVKSNTVNGYVKPTGAASHFRAEGKYVVRQGDPNVMNGGNNPGIYITAQVPSAAGGVAAAAGSDDSSPPVQAETPEEAAFLAAQGDALVPSLGAYAETGKLLGMAAVARKAGIQAAPCAEFIPGKKG